MQKRKKKAKKRGTLLIMKLLLLNTGYLSGLNGRPLHYATHAWRYLLPSAKAEKALQELVRKTEPDVIALTETTPKQIKNLIDSIHPVKRVAASKNKYRPESLLPLLPGFSNRHNAILMRSPVEHAFTYLKNGLHSLVIRARISPHTTFFLVHLALKKSVRAKQLAELKNMLQKETGNITIGGDFNAFEGASELEELLHACRLKNANTNHSPTFPTYNPKKELDYLLVSRNLTVKNFQVVASSVSDHAALVAEIV